MVSNGSAEELPPGWTVQFNALKTGRKVKYYVNLGTGQKFLSRDEVLRCIRRQTTQVVQPQETEAPIDRESKNAQMHQLVKNKNEHPEWLPYGWIMELKTRITGPKSGDTYKCFVDQSSGHRCYSKPQVFRYLTAKHKSCPSQKKETLVSAQLESKATIEKTVLDDLPPGWITEFKIRKNANGIKRDPYYTDPGTGYTFRSKRDVLRYLETGEITKRAFLSKKIHTSEKDSPSPTAKRQKLDHPATKQQLFTEKLNDAANQSSDVGNAALSENEAQRKGKYERLSTESVVSDTPVAKIHRENCLKDGAISDIAESKENSNAAHSEMLSAKGFDRNDKEPVFTPEANTMQEQKSIGSSMRRDNKIQTGNSLTRSNNRKGLVLPCRSSRRLAGLQPELMVRPVPGVLDATTLFEATTGLGSPEECLKDNVIDNVTDLMGNSTTSCLVQPKAKVSETGSEKVGAATALVSSHEADLMQEHNSLQNEVGDIRKVDTQCGLSKFYNEKGLEMPPCSLKQRTGLEPELVISPESSLQVETTFLVPPRALITSEKCPNVIIIDNGAESKSNASCLMGNIIDNGVESQTNTSCLEQPKANSSNVNLDKKACADNGLLLTPEGDRQHQSTHETAMRRSSEGKSPSGSRKLYNKKGLNLPRRTSKRLAGLEPELIANSISCAPAPQNGKRPSNNGAFLAISLAWDGLEDGSSKQLEAEPQTTILRDATDSSDPFQQELPNTSQTPLHGQAVPSEQSQDLEADKSKNGKSEPPAISPIGELLSDPCIEFAFKTLTGEIPVENAADNAPVSTLAADVMSKNIPADELKRCSNNKTPNNSTKSRKKKELSLPRRSSKRLAGLIACTSSTKSTPHTLAAKSRKTEAILDVAIAPDSAYEPSHQLKAEPEADKYGASADASLPTLHIELSNESKEPLNGPTVLGGQSGKPEGDNMKFDRPEMQPSFSFGDYWSDPCLEFAFKTLTGAISVDDYLPIQSYFQQQVNTPQSQRECCFLQQVDTFQAQGDGNLALPDFGLPGYFQTDISAHFDSPEKQPTSQPQFPLNNPPFLPPGNVSIPSCSSIGSQQPHLEANKGLSGKVNS